MKVRGGMESGIPARAPIIMKMIMFFQDRLPFDESKVNKKTDLV